MSFVNITPEIISQAAGDLESIGSNLAAANAAAAIPTTGLLPAGLDEVSQAITQVLGVHAQDYQALSNLAANFHSQFVGLLNSGAGQYVLAEAANAQQALASAGFTPSLDGGPSAPGSAVAGFPGGAVSDLVSGIAAIQANAQSLPMAFTSFFNSGDLNFPSPVVSFSQGILSGLPGLPGGLPPFIPSCAEAIAPAAVSPLPAGTGGSGAYASLLAHTAVNWNAIQANFTGQTVPAVLAAATNPFGVPQATLGAVQSGNPAALLGIPGQIATASAELTKQLSVPLSISSFTVQGGTAELNVAFGLPQQLAYDALGAPITGGIAAGQSLGTILDAVNSGNMGAAATALFEAPAHIADGFLNGTETISVDLQLPQGLGQATANIPVAGLLAPLAPLTASVTAAGLPFVQTFTVNGPQVGGLVPGVNSAVQQVATTLA